MSTYNAANAVIAYNGTDIIQGANATWNHSSNPTSYGSTATQGKTGRLPGREDMTGSIKVWADSAQQVAQVLPPGSRGTLTIDDQATTAGGTVRIIDINKTIPIETSGPTEFTVNFGMDYQSEDDEAWVDYDYAA